MYFVILLLPGRFNIYQMKPLPGGANLNKSMEKNMAMKKIGQATYIYASGIRAKLDITDLAAVEVYRCEFEGKEYIHLLK